MPSDNFNRANSGTLGANWTQLALINAVGISSNTAIGETTGNNGAAYTGSGAQPLDQFAQSTHVSGTGAGDGGPIIRSDTLGTFYLFDGVIGSTPTVFKCISNSFTSIQSTATAWSAGSIAYISATGTTITWKKNGTAITSFSDAAIDGSTVGGPYPGLFISSNSDSFDDWSGGSLAVGPTINTQPVQQTVWEGQTATFTVNATTSGGSLTYQWQLNGSDIGGATSSSYTTGALARSNNLDIYDCNVSDSNGTTGTATVYLLVLMAGKPCWIHA